MRTTLLAAGLAGLATVAVAQEAAPPTAPAPGTAAPAEPTAADWLALDPANTLVIDTTKGRIVVAMLQPDLAPAHVARIKALARQGYYTSSLFYRVIKDFMAQTGDDGRKQFRSALPNLKDEFSFQLKPTTPFVPVAPSAIGDLGFVGAVPVVIEPDAARPAGLPTTGTGHVIFCPGAAAFAHGTAPGTANSQIYFMRIPGGPTMERHYTAFGQVIQGQSVVEALNDGVPPPTPDKITRMRVLADIPLADRPKLQVMDTKSAAFTALVQRTAKEKGPNFNLCDVTVPVKAG